ncbi:UNVERIFIED_CONTAM: Caffeoylshikimate esterase [Sesamum radiatum]|uniref:Caffeoylshikimate esterase n=1 Tax=Sesamum radiatum TaxID=300843 RepID=A0AAW2UR32_SESRA
MNEAAGYGMECGNFMRGVGIKLASHGYGVFGIDYEGHGRSSGARCYIRRFDNIINDCSEYFKSICAQEEYRGKKRFLYGESMGGAVALLTHKKDPGFWDGAVLVAPMCKISEKVKPHPVVISLLTRVEDVIPKWKIVPTKDVIDSAFKDPVKREKVTLAFFVLHGEADTVTDPDVSRALYDRASSKDKTIKLYPGMWHGLTSGEPDDNIEIVFSDILSWLDKRSGEGGTDSIKSIQRSTPGTDSLTATASSTTVIDQKPYRTSSSGKYLCGQKSRGFYHHSAM